MSNSLGDFYRFINSDTPYIISKNKFISDILNNQAGGNLFDVINNEAEKRIKNKKKRLTQNLLNAFNELEKNPSFAGKGKFEILSALITQDASISSEKSNSDVTIGNIPVEFKASTTQSGGHPCGNNKILSVHQVQHIVEEKIIEYYIENGGDDPEELRIMMAEAQSSNRQFFDGKGRALFLNFIKEYNKENPKALITSDMLKDWLNIAICCQYKNTNNADKITPLKDFKYSKDITSGPDTLLEYIGCLQLMYYINEGKNPPQYVLFFNTNNSSTFGDFWAVEALSVTDFDYVCSRIKFMPFDNFARGNTVKMSLKI